MSLPVEIMQAVANAKAIPAPCQSRTFAALYVERARKRLKTIPAKPIAMIPAVEESAKNEVMAEPGRTLRR
ncbi:hypothetical protein [Methylocystis echinoides]|jgi:hypothetical protein|uniref:hypothetical protein n=1 Tax=Methylocystis echinoides TaxID=29468 RepID=UPI003424C718